MSAGAITSMIIILTTVGGGFVFFLTRAIKKERKSNG